jgi:hypothetical protein
LQQFQFQHKHLNFNNKQQVLSRIIKMLLPNKIPLLVCGHLFRINFQGFYFKNESHKSLVFDAVKIFTKETGFCKPKGIIVKDCEDVFIEQNCTLFGYHFFNGDVTMELLRRPHWFSLDDYLKDLHKKYLQRAKKIIKAIEIVEKRELHADEMEALEGLLLPGYLPFPSSLEPRVVEVINMQLNIRIAKLRQAASTIAGGSSCALHFEAVEGCAKMQLFSQTPELRAQLKSHRLAAQQERALHLAKLEAARQIELQAQAERAIKQQQESIANARSKMNRDIFGGSDVGGGSGGAAGAGGPAGGAAAAKTATDPFDGLDGLGSSAAAAAAPPQQQQQP